MAGAAAFRYFARPHDPRSSTWSDAYAACDVCGRMGPGFDGPFYGEAECHRACEDCVASGGLEAEGLATNEGDVGALREQLAATEPDGGERLVRERTVELAHRTPPLVTWQHLLWPAHCGDYCRYESEVGRAELSALAPDGDGWRFFLDHVAESIPDGFSMEDLPLRAPEPGTSSAVGVYHFRCVACGRSVIRWDCE
jgi:uncharacterized protein